MSENIKKEIQGQSPRHADFMESTIKRVLTHADVTLTLHGIPETD